MSTYNNANADVFGPVASAASSSLADTARMHGMTQDGADFVAMVLDPFTDERQQVTGMPDQTGGKSVIRDIRLEQTIQKPSDASVTNWDCNVAIMPGLCLQDGSDSGLRGDWDGKAFTNSTVGGWENDGSVIAWNAVPAGDDTFQSPNSTLAPFTHIYGGVQRPDLCSATRSMRLIAIGYQIINETPDDFISGTNTDYRVDNDHVRSTTDSILNFGPGTEFNTLNPALVGKLPPTNLAAAKQINGITRDTKEGSMVIGCYDTAQHKAEPGWQGSLILRGPAAAARTGTDRPDWLFGPIGVRNHPFGPDILETAIVREVGFLQSGTYLTNLSPETQLRLVVHMVIEEFPSPDDPDMELASYAAPFDPIAMEYLSVIQTNTLPGYPLSWNASGSLTRKFKRLFKKARKFIAPLVEAGGEELMGAGDPYSAAAGAGLMYLGKRMR